MSYENWLKRDFPTAFTRQTYSISEIYEWFCNHSDNIKRFAKSHAIVDKFLEQMRKQVGLNTLEHHGIKGQKWGVKNGPPYPLDKNKELSIIKSSKYISLNNKIRNIPDEKFTEYALDFNNSYDKAKAFKEALGYTKLNYKELIENINTHFDADKLQERGNNGYGMRYQQVMKLKGVNGKTANVLTAWIETDSSLNLTSVYVTEKEESK